MKALSVLGVLAVASVTFVLTGCPENKGGTTTAAGGSTAASTAAGGGDVKTAYDPTNEKHLFVIYAAHAANDMDLLKKTCQKYGLYDSNGVPVMEQYTKYTTAVSEYGQKNPEKWSKFVQDNNGKWADYVKNNGELDALTT